MIKKKKLFLGYLKTTRVILQRPQGFELPTFPLPLKSPPTEFDLACLGPSQQESLALTEGLFGFDKDDAHAQVHISREFKLHV